MCCCLLTLFSKICKKLNCGFCSKAALFIIGLVVSHSMAEFLLLSVQFPYIMEKWENQHPAKAATIINLQQGLTTISTIIVAHVANSGTLGLFSINFFSTLSYTMGITLYWISARLPSRNKDVGLYCAAALALALGKSSRDPALKSFLGLQFHAQNTNIVTRTVFRCCADCGKTTWWNTAWFIGAIIAFFVSITVTWATRFQISTLFMAANLLLFLSRFTIYERKDDTKKISNKVTEVKRLLILVLMCTTFVGYGMIKATGNTFFIAQSRNMDAHIIGKVKVPLMIFFLVQSFVSFITKLLFHRILNLFRRRQRVELEGIGAGMVCGILCCITAWRVELHRLKLIMKEGIGLDNDDPNKIILMSVFWLLPQFCLLGLMEGLGDKGLENFIKDYVEESMKRQVSLYGKLVVGFGNFFSIPIVLLKPSWFKDTINTSHLDRYFLTLAILGSVFLCIFVCISPMYANMKAQMEEEHSNEGICCC